MSKRDDLDLEQLLEDLDGIDLEDLDFDVDEEDGEVDVDFDEPLEEESEPVEVEEEPVPPAKKESKPSVSLVRRPRRRQPNLWKRRHHRATPRLNRSILSRR